MNLQRLTPPRWLFYIGIKKKYDDNLLECSYLLIYFLGIQFKFKTRAVFGRNNHILLNGKEVKRIKGLKLFIEGNDNHIEITTSKQTTIEHCKICVTGNKNKIQIFNPVYMNVEFKIHNDDTQIKILENSRLQKVAVLMCYPKKEEKISDFSQKLLIGKNFTCENNLFFFMKGAKQQILIGNDCMLSFNVYIWNTDSHCIYDQTTGKRLNYEKDVIIGNHVWIGRNASIHKGAIIPDGCIVGANSFVTKPFDEKNIILAGTPAKIVRQNVRWER